MTDINKKLLRRLKARLHSEFKKNFRRQAFFDKPWQPRSVPEKGKPRAILIKHDHLRKSIESRVKGDSIVFTSNVPYASVHNEGFKGTQSVKAHSRIIKAHTRHITARSSLKTRKMTKAYNQQVREHTQNVGAFSRNIEIPQRQFIGDHPKVRSIIKETIDEELEAFNQKLLQQLKQR